MSGQRAAAEPYTTSWQTSVRRVDGTDVRLKTTFFYAESGGQPADRGTIGGVEVVDVQREGDDVVHTLAETPTFAEGSFVLCSVDWDFRMYCMRAHTASHALYGAARRVLDDLGYGGFDIAPPEFDGDDVHGGKVRIDFRTSTDVDRDVLVRLEGLVNRVVWESREVTWEEVSNDEAMEMDAIAFNTKTEEGVFGESESVRVVTIGGSDGETPWDVAACGGTHVRNTREIGPVTVLDRSNPGEGLTRVEFVVGPGGIRRRADEKRAVLEASDALGAPVEEIPEAIERLRADRDELQAQVDELQRSAVEASISTADSFERDDRTWVVETVGGVGPNDVQDAVRSAVGEHADVVVLVGESGTTFVVAGSTGEPAADAVVAEVTEEFGGGGGGSDGFAQCGGLGAPPSGVAEFLRD